MYALHIDIAALGNISLNSSCGQLYCLPLCWLCGDKETGSARLRAHTEGHSRRAGPKHVGARVG
jgi:hypothetical protein